MPRQYIKSGKFSIGSEEVKCEICGKICKNIRSLEAHLRTGHNFGHNDKLYEDYYNQYLKKPEDGICIVCGQPTKQHKFKYDKCCCRSCAAQYSRSHVIHPHGKTDKYTEYNAIFAKQIKRGLHINISIDGAALEFEYFKKNPGNIHAQPNKNKLVLYYQQDNFYKEEKRLFSEDKNIRNRLIDNRVKYLSKEVKELSDAELIRGFKISGIYQSYSHFSPLWTKYFAEKYKLKYVADPFGGWGHHMIGFAAAECNYIYNDLSHETVEGVRKINEFLGTGYKILEGDAREFEIPNDCDAVFMCPPYYNLEKYDCGEFSSREEYDNLMLRVFDNCKSSNVKVIGIIIREDFEYLLERGLGKWNTKEEVNNAVDHFSKGGKVKEYLYCYER